LSSLVLDTHAFLSYLQDSPRLSSHAAKLISTAIHNGDRLYLSTISLVEIVYLVEKGRISADAWEIITAELQQEETPFGIVPLGLDVVSSLPSVSAREVPDMPDRIIAATAVSLRLPLITRDRKIQASQIGTIW